MFLTNEPFFNDCFFLNNTSDFQWLRHSNPQKESEKAISKRANIARKCGLFNVFFGSRQRNIMRFYYKNS